MSTLRSLAELAGYLLVYLLVALVLGLLLDTWVGGGESVVPGTLEDIGRTPW